MSPRELVERIGRAGILLLPAGLVIGILSPTLSQLARPLAEPLVALLFALSIYRLDHRDIVRQLRNPVIVLIGTGWCVLILPFVVYGAGRILDLPTGLLAVLVAWSACPPLVSIPGLAILFGLDGAVALLVMVGSAFAFTISLPLILSLLFADALAVDTATLLVRLLVLVSACVAAGQGIRFLVGHRRAERHAGVTDGVLVLLLSVFAISIMGGFHEARINDPGRIPLFIAVTFAASIGIQVVSAILYRPWPSRTGGAIALAAGNRNLSILLPVAGAGFGNDLILFLAIIQFPIYLLPVIAGPAYRWYCRGRPP